MPNTVALVAQTVVATVITLAQVKILANFLTKETFGLFVSLRGLSLLVAMLAANGLPQLLVRWLPVQEARGERAGAIRLGVISMALALAVLAALCVLVDRHHEFFVGFVSRGALSDGFFTWFYMTTAGVLVKQIVYGGLSGLRRIVAQVALELITLVAVLVWIAIDRNQLSLLLLFKILGIVHAVTAAAGALVFFWLVSATPAHPAQSTVAAGSPRIADYASYFVWAVGLSVIALAFTDVDRYLISQVLALELLALYHIAARVTKLANRVLGVPNLAFQPEITRIDSERRSDAIEPATRIFLKLNTVVSVFLTFAIALFARDIIIAVASDDYIAATPALIVLASSLPFTSITAPITTVMRALDQVKTALVVDLVWAVAYIVLLFALGSLWRLAGVTVAHVVACVLQLVLAVSLSRLGITLPFVLSVASRLVVIAALSFWPTALVDGMVGGAVGFGLKVGVFVLGCVAFQRLTRRLGIFDDGERATLLSLLGAPGSIAARLL